MVFVRFYEKMETRLERQINLKRGQEVMERIC